MINIVVIEVQRLGPQPGIRLVRERVCLAYGDVYYYESGLNLRLVPKMRATGKHSFTSHSNSSLGWLPNKVGT